MEAKITLVLQSLRTLKCNIADAARHEKIITFIVSHFNPHFPIVLAELDAIVNATLHADDRVKSLAFRLIGEMVRFESSLLALPVLTTIFNFTAHNPTLLFAYLETISSILSPDTYEWFNTNCNYNLLFKIIDSDNMFVSKSFCRLFSSVLLNAQDNLFGELADFLFLGTFQFVSHERKLNTLRIISLIFQQDPSNAILHQTRFYWNLIQLLQDELVVARKAGDVLLSLLSATKLISYQELIDLVVPNFANLRYMDRLAIIFDIVLSVAPSSPTNDLICSILSFVNNSETKNKNCAFSALLEYFEQNLDTTGNVTSLRQEILIVELCKCCYSIAKFYGDERLIPTLKVLGSMSLPPSCLASIFRCYQFIVERQCRSLNLELWSYLLSVIQAADVSTFQSIADVCWSIARKEIDIVCQLFAELIEVISNILVDFNWEKRDLTLDLIQRLTLCSAEIYPASERTIRIIDCCLKDEQPFVRASAFRLLGVCFERGFEDFGYLDIAFNAATLDTEAFVRRAAIQLECCILQRKHFDKDWGPHVQKLSLDGDVEVRMQSLVLSRVLKDQKSYDFDSIIKMCVLMFHTVKRRLKISAPRGAQHDRIPRYSNGNRY